MQVTLLPQPDSPTIPSTSPGRECEREPVDGVHGPSSVSNRTERSVTSSRGAGHQRVVRGSKMSRRPSPSTLNASAAKTIASPGIDGESRRLREVRLRVLEHHPPGRRRRLDSESEERQHRLTDDRARDRHRRLHEQRARHVGKDVPEDDRQVVRTVRDGAGTKSSSRSASVSPRAILISPGTALTPSAIVAFVSEARGSPPTRPPG